MSDKEKPFESHVIAALERMQPESSALWVWRAAGLLTLAIALVITIAWAWPKFVRPSNGGASASAAATEEQPKFTCGMHPEIVQDGPGTCPICGMNLTPMRQNAKKRRKRVTGEQACKDREIIHYQAPMDANYTSPAPGKSPMGMDLIPVCETDEMEVEGGVSISSRVRQNMGIRTATAKMTRLKKTIRAVGHVDYDERRIAVITTKVDGWIEGLSVDYTGQSVKKGDPLFAMYSPQLISTQDELVSARRAWDKSRSQRDLSILKAARKRLQYWDISQTQIERIERTGKTERTLLIAAPIDGVVIDKTAVDGKFVKAGTNVFKLADLSRVWIYAHLYEMDAPFVKEGALANVEVPYDGGPDLNGRVDFVFPWLSPKTREIKARLVFNNPLGRLKPEMYVDVNITADLGIDGLVIDDSAVIRTGVRNVVFVEEEPGTYLPTVVKLGRNLDGTVEITDGLKPGDKVVTKGQFMLDSESRLKEALQKFKPPQEDEEHDQTTPAEMLSALADKGCTHTCSMEVDFDVCGDGPTKCPKCGMTLVPLEKMQAKYPGSQPTSQPSSQPTDPIKKLEALEAQGCSHTCPMESHFHICGKGPGECPECGMTLRPIAGLKEKVGAEKP